MHTSQRAAQFDPVEARALISDLFQPIAWIYWIDMLVCLAVGYSCAAFFLRSTTVSPAQVAALVVASFALFRVGSFIHEIVHFRQGHLTSFVFGWNMLAGIPMLMPSFFYANHLDHHSAKHYGTGQDGEYLPLGSGPFSELAKFFSQVLFLPAQTALRFLLVTPLSFLMPGMRTWALERMSSFVINLKYRRREIPENAPRAAWALVEFLCFVRTALILVAVVYGVPRLINGEWQLIAEPWTRIPKLYVIAMCVLGLNYIRNAVAHRYESHGEPMSHSDQLLDSVNITGGWIFTELFFPLGLRYHALHHLYPTLPYHNLYAAHARLMEKLPADSPYRDTVFVTFWAALGSLVRNESAATRQPHPGSEAWYQRREELIARRERGERLFDDGPTQARPASSRDEAA